MQQRPHFAVSSADTQCRGTETSEVSFKLPSRENSPNLLFSNSITVTDIQSTLHITELHELMEMICRSDGGTVCSIDWYSLCHPGFQMVQLAFKDTNTTIKGTRYTRTPTAGFYDYNEKQEIVW